MPILDVEIITRPGEVLDEGPAEKLASRAAAIFKSDTGRTWVKLHRLPEQQYAENGVLPGVFRPVFVSIQMAQLPAEETMRQQAEQIAAAFAEACRRPRQNIHVLYQPGARGRIAFGGRLLSADR